MKKLTILFMFTILLVILSTKFASATEYNLRTGETVNGTVTRHMLCRDYTSYSAETIGKPWFIGYDTTEVFNYTAPPCRVRIKYSIEAKAGSTAGVYDFSVKYKIYGGPWVEYITLGFTLGIDVPDISISPPNFLPFRIVTSFETPGPTPEDLAFDGEFLWCADTVRDKIYKLDTSGNVISSIDSPNIFPGGLAFDGTYLWNTDFVYEKIYKLETAGNIIDSFDSPGSYPEGLAFDGTYLWNADSGENKIFKLDTSGNLIYSFDSPGSSPGGLAFDGKYLWNIDWSTKKMYKLDASGNVLDSFDTPGNSPQGLAFEGKYLWYADSYGTSGESKIYKLEMPTVGTTMRQLFTVENKGVSDLLIDTVSLIGKNVSEFKVENNNCSKQSMAPSQSCTFNVVFTPKKEGEKRARIEITSNDPDTPILTVSLDVTVGGSYRLMAMPWVPILLFGE